MMREMGFFDFKGFHSITPYTLDNIVSILMGKQFSYTWKSCKNGTEAYDNCPLAWKVYSQNRFITMYAEDSSQSFNWGGGGGFHKRPTDYYLHSLFNAGRKLRKRYPLKDVSDLCISNLNPQTFLFKYIGRFYKKFHSTPFFAYTWNGGATHDDPHALSGMDSDFMELLSTLREYPETLERTVVIVVADHGTRYGDVTKINYPGIFLERSLPALFIRIPDALEKNWNSANNIAADSSYMNEITPGTRPGIRFQNLLPLVTGPNIANDGGARVNDSSQAATQSANCRRPNVGKKSRPNRWFERRGNVGRTSEPEVAPPLHRPFTYARPLSNTKASFSF
jgi:hypothetical protein